MCVLREVYKYIRGTNTREALIIQCVDLRADNAIRNAVLRKNDSKILAIASRELVAAEACYHKTCYRDYTRNVLSNISNVGKEEEQDYSKAESRAYELLFHYIRLDLLQKPGIVRLAELYAQFIVFMDSEGVAVKQVKASTRTHFRRKLEGEFGDVLDCEDLSNNNKAFVIPRSLSRLDLAKLDIEKSDSDYNPSTSPVLKSKRRSIESVGDAMLPIYNAGQDNPFRRIPVDQTCEETINKDRKTPGGTKGFSFKPNSVSKYCLVAEYRSTFLRHLKAMLHIGGSTKHNDLQHTRIAKDEADAKSLVSILQDTWLNPFDPDLQDLVCFSTGKVATPDVEHDLLRAKDVGEEAYQAFREQRLESDPPQVNFHDTMTKAKLKTFTNLNKKVTVKAEKNQEVILKADRRLFAQMIVIAESRNLKMREVLSHPLGPLPWSLATPDGCDTVSCFVGRGKVGALKIMMGSQERQETLHQLGDSWAVTPDLFSRIERFVCQMYVSATTVADLQYHL
uniref:Uncharacterized protein n=1 Tax=Branchiostoma floridae TaxID=7739 RepID=C4A046_BRAFL|eukprot:XP_002585824.1 hypothetical protein BRAFLDRAFT_111039 [Branchiostoma floridae]